MKWKLLFIAGLLSLTSCKQASQTVVVAGDSWAAFVCTYNSLDKAFLKVGIKDVATSSTCMTTTKIGIHADNWEGTPFDKATQLSLRDPKVKALYLSLGGNDLIALWNKAMTADQENALFDHVISHLETIIQKYQSIRPDIRILISGYDFPRFTLNHPVKDYSKAYDDMGRPSPLELNSALLRFSKRVAEVADQKKVFYIQHYGLMQYYYGNTDTGLAAQQTLPPDQISPASDMTQTGGDIQSQTDKQAMLKVQVNPFIIYDAFHLNQDGFDHVAEHAVSIYLNNWFK